MISSTQFSENYCLPKREEMFRQTVGYSYLPIGKNRQSMRPTAVRVVAPFTVSVFTAAPVIGSIFHTAG